MARADPARDPRRNLGLPITWRLALAALLAAGCGLSAPPTGHSVSGTITGETPGGVTVTLGAGAKSYSATSGAGGAFSIGSVDDGSYVATATRAGSTFAPSAGHELVVTGADLGGIDFLSSATHHAIRGTVTGTLVAGVRLDLTGTSSADTTSATDGSYAFPDVLDGSYLVEPSLAGRGFSPGARVVTLAGADVDGQDFQSSVVSTALHAISGTVAGTVAAGVTLTLQPATGAAVTAVTSAAGAFRFADRADGTYTLTPSLTGYAFTPRSLAVTLRGADSQPQRFTAGGSSGAVQLEELPTGGHLATGLAIGNDLNAWITDGPAGVITRILLQDSDIGARGDVLDVPLSPADAQPAGIALRFFGLRCFTETRANRVGCMSWGGGEVFTVAIPTPASGAGAIVNGPGATALEPDMWFAEHDAGKVGRLVVREPATPGGIGSGAIVAEYVLPAGCQPTALAWTAEVMWWAAEGCGRIGWIDPALGTVHTIAVAVGRPIALAPNLGAAAVWFIDAASDRLGRLTQAGGLSWFTTPVPGSRLAGVALGPDKSLYLTEQAGNAVARYPLSSFDPGANPNTGRVTEEFALPTAGSKPQFITAGTDGNVWFTEGGQPRLGVVYMPTHCINGKVTLADLVAPVPSVTVTLTGPGGAATDRSDAQGNFFFCGLVPGAYLLTPALAARTFTPTSRPVTLGKSNLIGRDFVAR